MAEIVTFDRVYLGHFDLMTNNMEAIHVPVYCSKLSGIIVVYNYEVVIGWNRMDVKGFCRMEVVEAMDRLAKVTNGRMKLRNDGELFGQLRA